MSRLYAAADRAVAVIENGRVELTLDGGGARCLAVDPKDPDTVYVGTSDEGLFKSTDGGRSWERLSGPNRSTSARRTAGDDVSGT